MPLIGAEVDVEEDFDAGRGRPLGREQGGAAARLAAQAGAGDEQRASVGDGCGQHIVDSELHIRAAFPVEDQRESIGGLDPEQHRAGAAPRLAWDVTGLDALPGQELEDEVPDEVVPDRGQERRAQSQAACPDDDVGWTAADECAEAPDL